MYKTSEVLTWISGGIAAESDEDGQQQASARSPRRDQGRCEVNAGSAATSMEPLRATPDEPLDGLRRVKATLLMLTPTFNDLALLDVHLEMVAAVDKAITEFERQAVAS